MKERPRAILYTIQRTVIFFTLTVALSNAAIALDNETASVKIWADMQEDPAQITLHWNDPLGNNTNETTTLSYFRREVSDTEIQNIYYDWGEEHSLDLTTTSLTDTNVVPGQMYDYKIHYYHNNYPDPLSYDGRATVGINISMVEDRGRFLLVVDETMTNALAAELFRFEQDLIGDGWTVSRHNVPRQSTTAQAASSNEWSYVREIIRSEYNTHPDDLKAVLLFGRVAIPYCFVGDQAPDGHDTHVHAWPGDPLYALARTNWLANTQTYYTGYGRNKMEPGDGKLWGEYVISSARDNLAYSVGRVDMSAMSTFPETETELLRRYLNKNHAFRHKETTYDERCLIKDGFNGRFTYGMSGYRLGTLVGITNVYEGDFFSDTANQTYLWAYGSGGGSYSSCSGIGNTSDFASQSPQAVFLQFFGSYFGDYDSANNFMRASLASSGAGLTCVWGARPSWKFTLMGMGYPIGDDVLRNFYSRSGYSWYYGTVHSAFLGDPALRMHVLAPPLNLSSTNSTISWTASEDAGLSGFLGYHVYRASDMYGSFVRMTTDPITDTSWTDPSPIDPALYQVRAVRLHPGVTGTYVNNSQGVFLTVGTGVNQPPQIADVTCSPNPVPGTQASLSVTATDDGGETNLIYTWSTKSKPAGISDPTFSENFSNAAKSNTVTFSGPGEYSLRVTARDEDFLTATSYAEVTVTQTITTVSVSPATASIQVLATQQFDAVVLDQFGASMGLTPGWAVSGGGTIDASGLFTAGSVPGGPHTVTASAGGEDGTAEITVRTNSVPVADNKTAQTPYETPVDIVLTGSDADDDPLTFTIETQPSGGSVTGTPPAVTYTPTNGYSGEDSFTFTANDGWTDSAPATVTINVGSPLAADADADVLSGEAPLTVAFSGSASGGNPITGKFDTTDDGSGTISARGANGTSEGAPKAFDNSHTTKWLDFSPDTTNRSSWIQYQYATNARQRVTEYALTSANDAPERDPSDWQLLGSNDGGTNWSIVDQRLGEVFSSRFQTNSYTCSNPGDWNIYRLQIDSVYNPGSANSVQLAELELNASLGEGYTFAWDFNNDAVTDSTEQNPSHTFDNPGTYTVVLTVYDGSNTDTTNLVVTVTDTIEDTDGDGLPDDWETAYFGDATSAEPDGHGDADGLTNWEEYRAGTDPTNTASCLQFSTIQQQTNQILLKWYGSTNYGVVEPFRVQYRSSLMEGSWTNLEIVPRTAGTIQEWTHTDTGTEPGAYYRIMIPDP
ncbi:MAG: Ig-like domain-containing protein [Kiritimatiellia bacterium]